MFWKCGLESHLAASKDHGSVEGSVAKRSGRRGNCLQVSCFYDLPAKCHLISRVSPVHRKYQERNLPLPQR